MLFWIFDFYRLEYFEPFEVYFNLMSMNAINYSKLNKFKHYMSSLLMVLYSFRTNLI